MGTPGARLQGPFVSGSALATWLPAPVATTPASMTPRSSNARRCRRPLPATGSGGDAWSCARLLRMLIVLSLDCRIISQKPNAIPALLLRARREWLCGRAAERRDELAAFQLMEMHPIPYGPGAHSRIPDCNKLASGTSVPFGASNF